MSRFGRVAPWCAALAGVALTVGGCSGGPAPAPTPTAVDGTPKGTVERAEVGSSLSLTAVVDRVYGPRGFAVRDADLAEPGVLVLTARPVAVSPPEVVTVRGTVTVFSVARFASYQPDDPERLRAYEGRKVLVAERVRPLGGTR